MTRTSTRNTDPNKLSRSLLPVSVLSFGSYQGGGAEGLLDALRANGFGAPAPARATLLIHTHTHNTHKTHIQDTLGDVKEKGERSEE